MSNQKFNEYINKAQVEANYPVFPLAGFIVRTLFYLWARHIVVKRGASPHHGWWGFCFALWGVAGVALLVKDRNAIQTPPFRSGWSSDL
jgi:hypothetical protein